MRSEQEMRALIIGVAEADARIRAVILNGSRANPNAPRDIFQDFDVVYIVSDVAPFRDGGQWIRRFGDTIIVQTPDDMGDAPGNPLDTYAYLMLFRDGNRIDLTFFPVANVAHLTQDSQSLLWLDKDGVIAPFPPPSDRDYLPSEPSARQFRDCCNEFWWMSPYVAKGLWREEITYAKSMMEVAREQLMMMLAWYVGIQTQFQRSPGKEGKYLRQYLEPELWDGLLRTYSDAGYERNWDALQTAGSLFRAVALPVAQHFGFEYPLGDDERVSAHVAYVRRLPKQATDMY